MTEEKMLELWDKSGGDIYAYADLVADHEREKFQNTLRVLHDSMACASNPNGLTDEEREEIALEVPIDAVLITEAKLKEKNDPI